MENPEIIGIGSLCKVGLAKNEVEPPAHDIASIAHILELTPEHMGKIILSGRNFREMDPAWGLKRQLFDALSQSVPVPENEIKVISLIEGEGLNTNSTRYSFHIETYGMDAHHQVQTSNMASYTTPDAIYQIGTIKRLSLEIANPPPRESEKGPTTPQNKYLKLFLSILTGNRE